MARTRSSRRASKYTATSGLGLPVALLVNFNVTTLKLGLRRLTRKPNPTFLSSCLPVDSLLAARPD